MILIRFRDINRTYVSGGRSVEALRGVSLDIHEGEFVAIVGESGGGKSTLLSLIGLLDSPTSGHYELNGIDTSLLSERERTRLRSRTVGFVFQAFHLLDRRAVRDSVELGLLYQGLPRRERSARTLAALGVFGLEGRAEDRALELSGGQRQRVAIARAVATGNPIVLADEPTGNLDSENGAQVLRELVARHEAGSTVIVVTHSEEVASAANRVIRVADGRIVGDSGSSLGSRREACRQLEYSSPIPRRMGVRDLFIDALRTISSRATQSMGLALAVAVAVGFVVLTLGINGSAAAQVSEAFDRHANRQVSASWTSGASGAPDIGVALAEVQRLAGVTGAMTLADLGKVTVVNGGNAVSSNLRVVEGDLAAVSESQITWAGERRNLDADSVLLGRGILEKLKIGPLAAAPTVTIGNEQVAIAGVVENSQRFPELQGQVLAVRTAGFASSASEQSILLALRVVPGAGAQVGKQLPAAVSPLAPSLIAVSVPVDARTLRASVESGVQVGLVASTALALLIAAITLGNSMTMSLITRTGEMALRRAVGARPRDLFLLVTAEACIIGLSGGLLGVVMGVIALMGFTVSQRWMPVFDVRLAFAAVVLGILLASLSSVVAGGRAARLQPAVALRD